MFIHLTLEAPKHPYVFFFFFKGEIINIFKDSGMGVFVNSVKFLPISKSLQFFFPKKNYGYFENFDRIKRKILTKS
jgi:hypothetical protein